MKKLASLFLLAGIAFATPSDKVLAADPSDKAQTIQYEEDTIPSLRILLRYSTVLIFPGEKIVMASVGDEHNWVVDHSGPIVVLKAGAASVKTDLTVVCESGNVRLFRLREVSQEVGQQADLKVTVEAADQRMRARQNAKPMFVSADAVDQANRDAAEAKKALAENEAQRKAQLARDKDEAQRAVESSIRHDYTWKANKQASDFGLRSIYTVNGFTYFELDHPQEAPAIYEIKDGKDSLMEAELKPDGRYVVPKIVRQGYLRVGKARVEFRETEGRS